MLSSLSGRPTVFPTNGREDEFVITREDGTRQGIFKVWAQPILPTLSGLSKEKWCQTATEHPAFLEAQLRRAWRNSWLIDRDLATRFSGRTLSSNPTERVAELVGHLERAFGLMSPFYHLEAIVDDPAWLGLDTVSSLPITGGLDVVAFLLPSAFEQYVVATATTWNDLNWVKIHRLTLKALANPKHIGALVGLAGIFGVQPADLIFAANALQWIPTRVGGKKEDMDEEVAIARLQDIIQKSRERQDLTCLSVMADMNARIRFFNWLPLIKGSNNFDGRNWTYASVCDPTNALFQTLDDHPELWSADFREIYRDHLRPQLLNLDATSAKGRFLLDLILNEKRTTIVLPKKRPPSYDYARQGWIIHNSSYEFHQSCLVGTKPVGVVLAAHVLGREHVLPGLSIPTDSVVCRSYGHFAREVQEHYSQIHSWAVRSSSMDEGTARGVYDSILRVTPDNLPVEIETCVESYNRDGPVAFRRAKGLPDVYSDIEISVFLNPYEKGFGGVATVSSSLDNKGKLYRISVAHSPDQVTSGGDTEEFEFSDGTQAPERLASVVSILQLLHDVLGGAIQIEWVMNANNIVIVLQLEFMPMQTLENHKERNDRQVIEVPINSLTDITHAVPMIESQKSDEIARLVIGPEASSSHLFQGELFTMVVRLGCRVGEIKLAKAVSPSSHFANICRYFGIRLVLPQGRM